MRLICLSATIADPAGHVAMLASSAVAGSGGTKRRRVSRAATMDGGSVFSHYGFSASDTTIEVSWEPASAADEANIVRLFELYEELQISTRDGVYLVAPETYIPGESESQMSLLVVRKTSV